MKKQAPPSGREERTAAEIHPVIRTVCEGEKPVDALHDRPVPALHAAEDGRGGVAQVAAELHLAALRHWHDAVEQVANALEDLSRRSSSHSPPGPGGGGWGGGVGWGRTSSRVTYPPFRTAASHSVSLS